ncbi:MAG: hypothetical protein MRZ79_12955 [Bacteroidia bacterium]|nr:hypothetical protein [Bacteroidia bacterium]
MNFNIEQLATFSFVQKEDQKEQDRIIARYTRIQLSEMLGVLSLEDKEDLLDELEEDTENLLSKSITGVSTSQLDESRKLLRTNEFLQVIEKLSEKWGGEHEKLSQLKAITEKISRLKRDKIIGGITMIQSQNIEDEILKRLFDLME